LELKPTPLQGSAAQLTGMSLSLKKGPYGVGALTDLPLFCLCPGYEQRGRKSPILTAYSLSDAWDLTTSQTKGVP
jgi:hypothetical protein